MRIRLKTVEYFLQTRPYLVETLKRTSVIWTFSSHYCRNTNLKYVRALFNKESCGYILFFSLWRTRHGWILVPIGWRLTYKTQHKINKKYGQIKMPYRNHRQESYNTLPIVKWCWEHYRPDFRLLFCEKAKSLATPISVLYLDSIHFEICR